MPVERLFPRRNGSPGNLNVHTVNGRAAPAFNHYFLGDTDRLHYYIGCIETQAPTNSNPRMYAGVNKAMHRLDNGAITVDTTFNDVVQGMVIGDNGSGAKRLFVGFGSSTNPRIAYRDLTTDTTPWTVQTTSTYAQFWLITKAGADLYAVTDAGVAILGEYRISKCPAGNDPTLVASWGNGLEVGTPEWGINGLAAIGDSVVVGKPDGLYYYNDQTKRFENVLPHLVDAPHAVNGKGMRAVVNGVLYPTHDGKLYFFDGVAVQEVTPEKSWGILPRDVGTSRITAIADNGDTVAVVTECWQNTTQGLGLKVIEVDGGVATDHTANVTDGSLSTGGDIGGLGTTTTDYLYVGADVPFEAVCLRITRNVNAATEAWDTPQYSNGTTGTSDPFTSSFTAFSGIIDGSILGTAGISCVNTGFPPSASNAVLTWTDINAYDLMTSTQIQFGGSVGTLTKYWVRFPVGTTGFTASTTIDEVEIVPCRAGLPVTAANDFTHRDRAGGITHVYLGKRERTVGFVWHDVYAVHTYGGVWAMGWHSGRPGQASGAQNMGQQLVLWGRWRQVSISESPTRDPVRTIDPRLVGFGTTKPGPTLNLTPGTWDGGDPTRKKQLEYIVIDSRFVQPADDLEVFVQHEERDIIRVSNTSDGGPFVVDLTATAPMRYGNLWLTLNDAATGQVQGPYINEVRLSWHFVDDDLTQDPAEAIPSTT